MNITVTYCVQNEKVSCKYFVKGLMWQHKTLVLLFNNTKLLKNEVAILCSNKIKRGFLIKLSPFNMK